MSKVSSCSSEKPVLPKVPCRVPRSINPVYPVLLVLVLIVGAASTIAWFCGESCLENRAATGDARAQYLLGKLYFDTAVSAHDYARAARLIRKSADQRYAKAETALGLLYENGLGVTKSYVEAMKWIRRAADQGNPVAQNELGVMYAKGRGVPQNFGEAVKWCRRAANQGSEVALKNVQLAEAGKARPISQLTAAGKGSYLGAIVQKVEADGVTVSYSPVPGGFGMVKIKLEELPSNLKELCGYVAKHENASQSGYSRLSSVARAL